MARFFSGMRENTGKNASSTTKLLRDELRKKGRITPETYKKIMQQKLNEAKAKASSKEKSNFSMVGGQMASHGRKNSIKGEQTLKFMAEMALRKAANKIAKEVVIEVKRFVNGRIDEKGRIYDAAGNVVANVNMKNGAMTTIYGQSFGIYKPKSFIVNAAITEAINKNSPFLINQRKSADAQKNGVLDIWSRTSTDIWGNAAGNGWGRPKTDLWGRTQTDMWGNQQLDIWGNQI